MKLSIKMAMAVIAGSLMVATAARADTIINYTFDAGSFFNIDASNTYSLSGGFSYDATTQTISNVTYTADGTNGNFVFTAASVDSPTQVTFSGDGGGDNDTYIFGQSLALGGTDPIIGALYQGNAISGGGSVSSAVPEPATWALALVGFGLIGGALRKRTVRSTFGCAHA